MTSATVESAHQAIEHGEIEFTVKMAANPDG
jgi:hypothetical protein